MAWKFWKTEKSSDEPTEKWPANTNEALQHLLGLYQRSDAAPFSKWEAPGIEFSSAAQPFAQSGAQGYQLALWFWLFAEKHGTLAAKMVRDSFSLLADGAQHGSGDAIEALLDLENRIAHAFENVASDELTFRADGLTVELPLQYVLASAYLKLAPGSPYAGVSGADMNGDDFKLAACLQYASDQAITIFRPAINGLEFDPSTLSNWKWSVNPGAAERHLKRRQNNPLFPLHRQMVTASDVYDARLFDTRILQEIRHELTGLSQEFRASAELPLNWRSYLEGFRERLEGLEDRRWIAGPENSGLGDAVAEVRRDVLNAWRSAIQKNRQSLTALNQEEVQKAEYRAAVFKSDLTAQLLSQGSQIPPDEIVPSLLSEPPHELEQVVACMQADPRLHETLVNCRGAAHRLVDSLRAAGLDIPDAAEKLAILDGTPGRMIA